MEKEKRIEGAAMIVAVLAALAVGIALGVFAHTAWEGISPEPLFSLDPEEITQVHIRNLSAAAEYNDVTIIDRERIDYVVELLNGFQSQSSRELESRLMGWDSRLELFTPNSITFVYFSTGDSGDSVRISHADNSSTVYETSPGYFRELTRMPSTDPATLYEEPLHPGPTAQPSGT